MNSLLLAITPLRQYFPVAGLLQESTGKKCGNTTKGMVLYITWYNLNSLGRDGASYPFDKSRKVPVLN
jgi:hypothetical protein